MFRYLVVYRYSYIVRCIHCKKSHFLTRLFLCAEDLDVLTRLVLVNVIYFKSFWEKRFSSPQNKAFSPRNGTAIQVPTLSRNEVYHAGECSHIGAKFVHLEFVVSTFKLNISDIIIERSYGLEGRWGFSPPTILF